MNDYETEQKQTSDVLKKIFSPAFLCLGLIGNIISIVIFNQKSMKKYTTFRYLTLLSIIDICALYIGFAHIMLNVYFDVDIRLINEASCKIQSFLVYFFTHFSSALLAVMSIDRTISITFKLKKFSTPKTALKHFFTIGTIIFFIDLHFLLFTHLYDLEIPAQNHSDTQDSDFLKLNSSCNSKIPTFFAHTSDYIDDQMNSNCSRGSAYKLNELTIKICYAYLNTYYFHYLANYFPW